MCVFELFFNFATRTVDRVRESDQKKNLFYVGQVMYIFELFQLRHGRVSQIKREPVNNRASLLQAGPLFDSWH